MDLRYVGNEARGGGVLRDTESIDSMCLASDKKSG